MPAYVEEELYGNSKLPVTVSGTSGEDQQISVAAAVREAFADRLFAVEHRLVFPHEYRLLQVADLACTLELLRLKDASGTLTRSDLAFFGSPGRLRRNYLRHVGRLRMA